jgi:hypothetical protein
LADKLLMKVVVDQTGDGFGDPWHGSKIIDPGFGDRFCGPEMREQRLLSGGSNTGNLVQRVLGDVLFRRAL